MGPITGATVNMITLTWDPGLWMNSFEYFSMVVIFFTLDNELISIAIITRGCNHGLLWI